MSEPLTEEEKFIVKDFMAKQLVTFKPDMSIFEAVEALLKHQISGAPVVDDAGVLVGMLSEKDCMKVLMGGAYYNQPGGKISDYMSSQVETISPNMAITSVARKFSESNYRRFPVVNEGKLLGQLSRRDVLSAIQAMKRTTWKPQQQ